MRKQSSTSSTVVLRVVQTFKNQVDLQKVQLGFVNRMKENLSWDLICRYESFAPLKFCTKYYIGHMWIEGTPFPLYLKSHTKWQKQKETTLNLSWVTFTCIPVKRLSGNQCPILGSLPGRAATRLRRQNMDPHSSSTGSVLWMKIQDLEADPNHLHAFNKVY